MLCKDPRNAQTFAREEFAYYFAVAMSAAELRMRTGNPETVGVVVELEDGSTEGLCLADHPMNRAMLATRREISNAWMFLSFQWRFWALMELVHDNKLGNFFRESPDAPGSGEVHPAVLEAAGRLPLTKQGHFRPAEFLRNLKALTGVDD